MTVIECEERDMIVGILQQALDDIADVRLADLAYAGQALDHHRHCGPGHRLLAAEEALGWVFAPQPRVQVPGKYTVRDCCTLLGIPLSALRAHARRLLAAHGFATQDT